MVHGNWANIYIYLIRKPEMDSHTDHAQRAYQRGIGESFMPAIYICRCFGVASVSVHSVWNPLSVAVEPLATVGAVHGAEINNGKILHF